LIGTWSSCENDNTEPVTSYKSILTFNNSVAEYWYIYYLGPDCLEEDKELTEFAIYNFSLNSSLLTMVVQSFSTTFHKETSVVHIDLEYANETSFCGISDWEINIAKDITNLDCEGYIVSNGDSDSSSISISGNKLVLGSATYYRNK
jgi:hypothetical protein